MSRNNKANKKEMSVQTNAVASNGRFPFKFEDLRSWTIKRNDGTVTKFVLTTAPVSHPSSSTKSLPATQTRVTSGLGDYCSHKPGDTPLVTFDRDNSPIRLWIGNMSGAKATRDSFDFVVDCGDIFNSWNTPDPVLTGDPELIELLLPYTYPASSTRMLKIDWDDRQAPNAVPEFWVELNKLLYGDIMTCCVGGHGRSGTSFVCLLLVNAPDYDALDALIHTRAVHCPRAIESVSQHKYIDEVAKYLKRETNASKASQITDYKAAFMASQKPTAIRTKERLGWK